MSPYYIGRGELYATCFEFDFDSSREDFTSQLSTQSKVSPFRKSDSALDFQTGTVIGNKDPFWNFAVEMTIVPRNTRKGIPLVGR